MALSAADMDGVMMNDGKMMLMKSGKPAGPMDHAIRMSDGTTVLPDGTIKFANGTIGRMENGEIIMMDGHVMRGGKAAGMNQ
ncbi:MAG TPA: DUF6799 domain-containing protein [Candidatus Binataceae bacterium]|nr:DUF6799 domain-containing protein [Candidatus Binataceae bacterium]